MAPERRSLLPWCQSSQVSVTARLERRSGPSGRCEHGGHPSVLRGCLLLASAARRFLGVAMALPRGSAQSREPLTQDSRSAVKARLFRSVTRIIRREALHPSRKKTWRPRRGRQWDGALRHAKEPLESARRSWHARVRHCGSDDARQRHECALRPHATRVCELRARGTRAARRPSRDTTAVGGDLGVGLG